MGIDHLDIVFRIKKRFGVELRQDEWGCLCDTAGFLHEFLCAKLDGRRPEVPDVLAIQRQIQEWIARQPWYRRWRMTLRKGRFAAIIAKNDLERARRDLAEHLGRALPDLEYDSNGVPRWPSCAAIPWDLTRWLIRNSPAVAPPVRREPAGDPPLARTQWTHEKVWQTLREILVDALGVSLDKVVPDARLVEDLGMD